MSFTDAELVVRDQFLLGMRSQLLCKILWERLKFEQNLMMHQVLKEAIAMKVSTQGLHGRPEEFKLDVPAVRGGGGGWQGEKLI